MTSETAASRAIYQFSLPLRTVSQSTGRPPPSSRTGSSDDARPASRSLERIQRAGNWPAVAHPSRRGGDKEKPAASRLLHSPSVERSRLRRSRRARKRIRQEPTRRASAQDLAPEHSKQEPRNIV